MTEEEHPMGTIEERLTRLENNVAQLKLNLIIVIQGLQETGIIKKNPQVPQGGPRLDSGWELWEPSLEAAKDDS